jgi:membrane-associated phospholipid phosphatase
VFEALNGLVGRSWLLDSLIALALDNLLVKAGPVCACFFFAWYQRGGMAPAARRGILLVTLLSLFLIAPLTKSLSDSRLSPRPFVLAHPTYVLRDGQLVEQRRIDFRTIQTGDTQRRIEALREGRIEANDLGTFPSDHAAFFVALALGILLASRAAGTIALGWTLVVTLATRVAVGMHWPLDVAAGALIGAAVLLGLQFAFAGKRARWLAPVTGWAERFPGLTAALLFLVLLEAANSMQTAKRLLELVAAIVGRIL